MCCVRVQSPVTLPVDLHVRDPGVYEIRRIGAVATILVRYVVAGGMVIVSIPMDKNLRVHYAPTVLAAIATAFLPVPYLLYFFGERIKGASKRIGTARAASSSFAETEPLYFFSILAVLCELPTGCPSTWLLCVGEASASFFTVSSVPSCAGSRACMLHSHGRRRTLR